MQLECFTLPYISTLVVTLKQKLEEINEAFDLMHTGKALRIVVFMRPADYSTY